MIALQEAAYWMAFAHLPKWRTEKINRLLVEILHHRNLSFAEFFKCTSEDWQHEFSLSQKEVADLEQTQKELPNYSFLAEKLFNEGIEFIPLNSEKYSKTLKRNLKMQYAPPLLYVKGNTQLLNELCVAVVGSRNASETALTFTQNIARQCSKNYEVIVSGFAKGVDKTALDAALEVYGQSIIVLPQGVLTFASGFRKYYKPIVEGNVLVVSTYHPKVPWNVGFAMRRNVYIYGLADKIYVAESNVKGGTWAGVRDGLRKERTIYVRQPEPEEQNANALLIEQGAIPVNMQGEPLETFQRESIFQKKQEEAQEFDQQLNHLLAGKSLTAKQIKEALSLETDTRQLSRILSQKEFLTTRKIKKTRHFSLVEKEQQGKLL